LAHRPDSQILQTLILPGKIHVVVVFFFFCFAFFWTLAVLAGRTKIPAGRRGHLLPIIYQPSHAVRGVHHYWSLAVAGSMAIEYGGAREGATCRDDHARGRGRGRLRRRRALPRPATCGRRADHCLPASAAGQSQSRLGIRTELLRPGLPVPGANCHRHATHRSRTTKIGYRTRSSEECQCGNAN
jgi:hypothetical protein